MAHAPTKLSRCLERRIPAALDLPARHQGLRRHGSAPRGQSGRARRGEFHAGSHRAAAGARRAHRGTSGRRQSAARSGIVGAGRSPAAAGANTAAGAAAGLPARPQGASDRAFSGLSGTRATGARLQHTGGHCLRIRPVPARSGRVVSHRVAGRDGQAPRPARHGADQPRAQFHGGALPYAAGADWRAAEQCAAALPGAGRQRTGGVVGDALCPSADAAAHRLQLGTRVATRRRAAQVRELSRRRAAGRLASR